MLPQASDNLSFQLSVDTGHEDDFEPGCKATYLFEVGDDCKALESQKDNYGDMKVICDGSSNWEVDDDSESNVIYLSGQTSTQTATRSRPVTSVELHTASKKDEI